MAHFRAGRQPTGRHNRYAEGAGAREHSLIERDQHGVKALGDCDVKRVERSERQIELPQKRPDEGKICDGNFAAGSRSRGPRIEQR
jgi:hypothetical protein